jgi:2,3-bisphosphoglycerate-independent phosphoglycerate mutase
MKSKHPVILIIRDGWGYRKNKKDNCIALAKTPNTDRLTKEYPNALLDASGEAVGLPKGYQGNSEVGHMTIGSGRIIFQSLERINKSIRDKDFFKIPEFLQAIKNCRKHRSKLHLIGLLQVEGVHSHINHLFALLDLCKKENFKDVCVHAITDGRDSPVKDSLKHISALQKKLKNMGFGKIASVSGRYFAMDRDRRWDRTKKAYDCIVDGKAEEFTDALKQVKECHAKKETDEFIKPRKLIGYGGVKKNDSIIFFNFRTDRPRQLTRAIVEKKFDGWKRKPLKVFYVAMTQYYSPMNAKVAFKDIELKNLLGEIISKNRLKQLRISETEKYAHVTFFFNCQLEKPNKNEDRILIHSPKVATYDLKPEMSAYEVTNNLVEEIDSKKYDFIVTNLVNGDMVGHTGNMKAIIKGIEAVDDCVGKITAAGLKNNYTLLIFADHGNAEDKTKAWMTSHTVNPVPLIIVSEQLKKAKLKARKGLKDIAPTVLKILKIKKPTEMSGESIVAE